VMCALNAVDVIVVWCCELEKSDMCVRHELMHVYHGSLGVVGV